MVKLLAMLMAGLWSWTPMDGILPEFGHQLVAKKQPDESLLQTSNVPIQSFLPAEPDATVQPPAANLPMIAPSSALHSREAAITKNYLQLAAGSGGQFYNAIEAPLPRVLDALLEAQLVEGADIVFLIDHTSSMEDDIDEIRQELSQLIARFSAKKGVRVGIVTFSDVKSGSKFGYHAHNLSNDYAGLSKFLESVELLGSVEDVYGAIFKTVEEFDWKSKTKRLIVIISDEQPATGSDTNYSEDKVLAKCAEKGVGTNLYPVLVDKYLPVK